MSITRLNVDLHELDKFSEGDWWDATQGAYAMLHQLNPVRLNFIKAHTALAHSHVLDVGCGGGILAEALAKEGAQVVGIDLNTEALAQASSHAQPQALSLHYKAAAVEAYAEAHLEKFDVVSCMEMLEHVPDPEAIIGAIATLLKPHGKAFFSTINRTPRAYLEAVVGAEYLLKLLPKGTHNYQKFIKPSELCAAARAAGLELIALNGISYDPWKKHFSLVEKPAVNYLVAFSKKATV